MRLSRPRPERREVISLVLAHVAADHPSLAETETAEDIQTWIELLPE